MLNGAKQRVQQPRLASEPLRKFHGVTVAELLTRADGRSGGYLVGGLVPRCGVTLVVGLPRARKTSMLACMAAAVAMGKQFAGRAVHQGAVVLILQDRDDGTVATATLLHAALRGVDPSADPDATDLTILDPPTWSLDTDVHVDELCRYLDEVGAVALVVDSLRRVSAFDENRSNETSDVTGRLNRLARERAVLVVHHAGKDGRTRGSTDLEASVTSTLRVTASQGGGVVTVHALHHHAPEQTVRLRVEQTKTELRFAPMEGMDGPEGVDQEVLDVVRAHGRLSARKVRGQLKAGDKKTTEALARLVAAGRLVETGGPKGRSYELAP